MATPAVVTESPAAPVAAAPKKAAPAAKAKKAEPETTEDTRQITPLLKVTAIPCKPGSFCYAQVHAALTSKNVQEAARKLAADPRNPTRRRKIEVGWMVKKRYI